MVVQLYEHYFTLFTVVCFIMLIAHSVRIRKIWWTVTFFLPIIISAVVFENISVSHGQFYYPNFFLYIGMVPLTIAIGWAVIIYITYVSSNYLSMKFSKNPIYFYPFIAVAIDFFIIEPIAIYFEWWIWKDLLFSFIAPLTNYAAWFALSVLYLTLFEKTMKVKAPDYAKPILMFISFLVVIIPMTIIHELLCGWSEILYSITIMIYGFFTAFFIRSKQPRKAPIG